jgi:hypothetical protein
VSDIDTVLVASLKALDPERPIREADIRERIQYVCFVPLTDIHGALKCQLDSMMFCFLTKF